MSSKFEEFSERDSNALQAVLGFLDQVDVFVVPTLSKSWHRLLAADSAIWNYLLHQHYLLVDRRHHPFHLHQQLKDAPKPGEEKKQQGEKKQQVETKMTYREMYRYAATSYFVDFTVDATEGDFPLEYPTLSLTEGTATLFCKDERLNVIGRSRAGVNTNVIIKQRNPISLEPEGGCATIFMKLGRNEWSANQWNIGLTIGANNIVFHPGYTGTLFVVCCCHCLNYFNNQSTNKGLDTELMGLVAIIIEEGISQPRTTCTCCGLWCTLTGK